MISLMEICKKKKIVANVNNMWDKAEMSYFFRARPHIGNERKQAVG